MNEDAVKIKTSSQFLASSQSCKGRGSRPYAALLWHIEARSQPRTRIRWRRDVRVEDYSQFTSGSLAQVQLRAWQRNSQVTSFAKPKTANLSPARDQQVHCLWSTPIP